MEDDAESEIVVGIFRFFNWFLEHFEFLAHLRVVLISTAAVICVASLYGVLAKKKNLLRWVELTALATGIISIPYSLFQLILVGHMIFLETHFGGFFGPETSGGVTPVYYIPTVLLSVFPLIGLAYLTRRVRGSCLVLLILSLVYVVNGPILSWLAVAP